MIVAITKIYKKILHGIAFYPLVNTLFLAILAVFLVQLSENASINLPSYFKINKVETTLSLLSSILTGMISLTVFGFSMMMVVTNQAATIYSPKVVESLLNDNSNKFTLGFYIGTIIFTIITIMHVDEETTAAGLPHFAVFVNILLQIFSILLFLSFINNIGNSVRITKVVDQLFHQTKTQIQKEDKKDSSSEKVDTKKWTTFPANNSGYFQFVRISSLLKILKKHDLMLEVLPLPGIFYSKLTPLFAINKYADDEVLEEIRSTFVTYAGELIEDNEYYGFRQLREVAVKALSPGVNDPGVARICIDYLGELLAMWMFRDKSNIIKDTDKESRIILNRHDFESMLGECFTPVKIYGKRDYTIMIAILNALQTISLYDVDGIRKKLMNLHAYALVEDAEKNIENFLERGFLNETIKIMNNGGYFNIPELKNLTARADSAEKVLK